MCYITVVYLLLDTHVLEGHVHNKLVHLCLSSVLGLKKKKVQGWY